MNQSLFACAAAVLLLSVVALIARTEWLNSVVIIACSLMTLILLIAMARSCLHTARIGLLLFTAGVLASFWLGAWQCMSECYIPRSDFILGELGGSWKPGTIAMAVFYIALFQCLGLVGYCLGPVHNGLSRLIRREDHRTPPFNNTFIVFLLISLMFFTLYIRHGGSISGLLSGLARSRIALYEARDVGLLMNFVWLGYYGLALGIVSLILTPGQRFSRLMLLPIVMAGMLIVFADGTRHRMLYAFGSACLVLLHKGIRKNPRCLKLLMATSLILIGVYQCQSLSRNIGWLNLLSHQWKDFVHVQGTDQFQSLSYALELVPGRHEYFHTPATLFFVTHWIPRRFWPAKPSQPELEYLSTQWTGGANLQDMNVTPSIIGQYHMNWGVFGVAWIGFFMGWMFRCVDAILISLPFAGHNHSWVLMGMFVAFLIASFRHFSPMYFMFLLFGLIIFIVCTRPSCHVAPLGTGYRSPEAIQ